MIPHFLLWIKIFRGTAATYAIEDVTYRIVKAWDAGELLLNNAMTAISQKVKNNSVPLPNQIVCRQINESDCVFTK